jgi:hypothetical protein
LAAIKAEAAGSARVARMNFILLFLLFFYLYS